MKTYSTNHSHYYYLITTTKQSVDIIFHLDPFAENQQVYQQIQEIYIEGFTCRMELETIYIVNISHNSCSFSINKFIVQTHSNIIIVICIPL